MLATRLFEPNNFERRQHMKFLLIGATGLTGEAIVKQGLDQGHHITALVRDASKVAAYSVDRDQ
jgi:uncharacterized protein YbjT (DUF2867 family)